MVRHCAREAPNLFAKCRRIAMVQNRTRGGGIVSAAILAAMACSLLTPFEGGVEALTSKSPSIYCPLAHRLRGGSEDPIKAARAGLCSSCHHNARADLTCMCLCLPLSLFPFLPLSLSPSLPLSVSPSLPLSLSPSLPLSFSLLLARSPASATQELVQLTEEHCKEMGIKKARCNPRIHSPKHLASTHQSTSHPPTRAPRTKAPRIRPSKHLASTHQSTSHPPTKAPRIHPHPRLGCGCV